MAKTYHDRYVEALIARGWRIDAAARSSKYTVLVQGSEARGATGNLMSDPTTKMFVGKSGAVRYGKTVSDSFSMLEAVKQLLLVPMPAAEKVS